MGLGLVARDSKTDDQLDGAACWYCGHRYRPATADDEMVPVSTAPRPPSWRFRTSNPIVAHPACKPRGDTADHPVRKGQSC